MCRVEISNITHNDPPPSSTRQLRRGDDVVLLSLHCCCCTIATWVWKFDNLGCYNRNDIHTVWYFNNLECSWIIWYTYLLGKWSEGNYTLLTLHLQRKVQETLCGNKWCNAQGTHLSPDRVKWNVRCEKVCFATQHHLPHSVLVLLELQLYCFICKLTLVLHTKTICRDSDGITIFPVDIKCFVSIV